MHRRQAQKKLRRPRLPWFAFESASFPPFNAPTQSKSGKQGALRQAPTPPRKQLLWALTSVGHAGAKERGDR